MISAKARDRALHGLFVACGIASLVEILVKDTVGRQVEVPLCGALFFTSCVAIWVRNVCAMYTKGDS